MPQARAALDIGALHVRAMRFDEKSRVLSYRMTNQCASGSGQFLENVARYLGITLEDIGPLSCSASSPEMVSSICAVLAETDVINMVSRGITTANILKGIHLSMAGRYLKLLRAIGAEGTLAITGGLSADVGLAQALRDKVCEEKLALVIVTDPRAIYAGALGAALWGRTATRSCRAEARRERFRLAGPTGLQPATSGVTGPRANEPRGR